MNHSRTRPYLALVLLVWLAALVAGYYVGHKPFGGETALAVARAALDLLAVAALVALGGALGTLLLPAAPDPLSPAETLAIRALLGLGVLSLTVFALVALALIPPAWLAWLLTLAGLAALHRHALRWLRSLRNILLEILPPPGGRWTRFIALSVLLLLGMALVVALAPPSKWDALVYHLAAPTAYLRAGRFVDSAANHFHGFPQAVEMLYLWLLRMRGPLGTATAPLHFAFGGLLLLLLIGLATRLTGSARVGWLAAAVLLVSDSFWGQFAWPYVDLAASAYTLAAFVAITLDGKPRWLLGGLLTGFALSTKYTLAGPAIGLGLLALSSHRERGLPAALWTAARFTAVALAVLAPWLVKNALLEGNPIAPLIFPSRHFDALDQFYYLRPGTGLPLWQLLAAPVHATIIGREAGAPYGSSAGALLVALLPLILVGWRARPDDQRAIIRRAFVLSLPAYLLWVVGNGVSWFLVQTRLLFPIFPALALVGALGLEGLRTVKKPFDVGWLARALVGIVVALALVNGTLNFIRSGATRAVLGLQPTDDYLGERLGWYHPMTQELSTLPADARVLFLWEPRTFYCPASCTPDSMLNLWWRERQFRSDPLVIARRWRDAGFTHVLVHESGLRFIAEEDPVRLLTDTDLAAFERLRGEAWEVVWQGGDAYTLYTWRAEEDADGN